MTQIKKNKMEATQLKKTTKQNKINTKLGNTNKNKKNMNTELKHKWEQK